MSIETCIKKIKICMFNYEHFRAIQNLTCKEDCAVTAVFNLYENIMRDLCTKRSQKYILPHVR